MKYSGDIVWRWVKANQLDFCDDPVQNLDPEFLDSHLDVQILCQIFDEIFRG